MDKMLYDREKLDRQIEDTVSRVKAAASEDSLVMPVFTDLHANGLDDSAFVQLLQALEAVSTRLKIDAMIGLGDNLAMLGRNVHASNEMIKELLTGIFDRVSAVCDVPLYLVHGNHDGIGTDFFSAEFWYSIVGGKYDGGMAHREEGSAYFYADYEKQGIRIISLSAPCGSDMEAEYPTPLWRFGDRQLKWLAEKALDTPGGWDVLVLCHVPFYSCYRGDMTTKLSVWTGDREAESYISALSGWIEDRQEAEEILRAYHEGVVYCNEEKDIHGNYTEKSAHIIACLSGHIHKDRLFAPGEQKGNDQNRLVCPQAAITSAKSSYNKETREKAEFGIAFDVLVLTPSEKCLSLIRFGDGEDRRIYYDSREEKK